MPFNIIFEFCAAVFLILLGLNLVFPLFVPKYKIFWMLRNDKYVEAAKGFEQAAVEKEIEHIKRATEKVKEYE